MSTNPHEVAQHLYSKDVASQQLGIQIESVSRGRASGAMRVTASMLNGHRICHGAFIFALADSMFAFACNSYNEVTLASGGDIEFLLPAKEGDLLTANAEELARSKRNGVYLVTVKNEAGDSVAILKGRAHIRKDEKILAVGG